MKQKLFQPGYVEFPLQGLTNDPEQLTPDNESPTPPETRPCILGRLDLEDEVVHPFEAHISCSTTLDVVPTVLSEALGSPKRLEYSSISLDATGAALDVVSLKGPPSLLMPKDQSTTLDSSQLFGNFPKSEVLKSESFRFLLEVEPLDLKRDRSGILQN